MIMRLSLLFAILSLPIAAPAATRETRDATPKGNPSSWFKKKDYPSEAKRNNQRGRVAIVLQVSKKDVPTSCGVNASSGSVSLDEATCRLAMERGRFRPALTDGHAVEGHYALGMFWTLNDR